MDKYSSNDFEDMALFGVEDVDDSMIEQIELEQKIEAFAQITEDVKNKKIPF